METKAETETTVESTETLVATKATRNNNGFKKAENAKESTYNGASLWTFSYDQWFELLTGLAKGSDKQSGKDKQTWTFNGVRLWTSSWDEKLAMLEALAK